MIRLHRVRDLLKLLKEYDNAMNKCLMHHNEFVDACQYLKSLDKITQS